MADRSSKGSKISMESHKSQDKSINVKTNKKDVCNNDNIKISKHKLNNQFNKDFDFSEDSFKKNRPQTSHPVLRQSSEIKQNISLLEKLADKSISVKDYFKHIRLDTDCEEENCENAEKLESTNSTKDSMKPQIHCSNDKFQSDFTMPERPQTAKNLNIRTIRNVSKNKRRNPLIISANHSIKFETPKTQKCKEKSLLLNDAESIFGNNKSFKFMTQYKANLNKMTEQKSRKPLNIKFALSKENPFEAYKRIEKTKKQYSFLPFNTNNKLPQLS